MNSGYQELVEERDTLEKWVKSINHTNMPISFNYNNKCSKDWFKTWKVDHSQSEEANFTIHNYICHDQETNLKCILRIQVYKTTPALLWNLSFTNTGIKDTPILDKVKTLNITRPSSPGKQLTRAQGSFNYSREGEKMAAEDFRDNFMLVEDDLKEEVIISATGGRSSVDWMPYFNYYSGGNEGVMFGIGWTGQWQAKISSQRNEVKFQTGMEYLRTILKPGETISQPSTLMIFWHGNQAIRGHNLLRHFIYQNLLPRYKGKVLQAPACNLTWGGMTTAGHLERIQNLENEKLPFDYYWIDAGWYGDAGPNKDVFDTQWHQQTGNWRVNDETYPNGMQEISDVTHNSNKKFLLWVEPERAIIGTPITQEHPEWFLKDQNDVNNELLNLGKTEARVWCTDLISNLITEQGLDCYRQDFNISPLPFWQNADQTNRVGISEIRYIEGLYTFLGDLRQRFPHLLIDNCASGGRRLDFEMMRYSMPLWGSDMQCFPEFITERNQQQVQGLSYWLPQFAFGTMGHAGDTYHFRSTMAAGFITYLFSHEHEIPEKDYPYEWLRERLHEYHRAKIFFSGDFYPLQSQSASMNSWTAYQFHRPDLDEGMLLVFRKSESETESMQFTLNSLQDINYNFEAVDAKTRHIKSGSDLKQNGITIQLKKQRQSFLAFYSKY